MTGTADQTNGTVSQCEDAGLAGMDLRDVMSFSPASSALFAPYGSYSWGSLEASSPSTSSEISAATSSEFCAFLASELAIGCELDLLDGTMQYSSYADATQPSHHATIHLDGPNQGTMDQGAGTGAAARCSAIGKKGRRGRPRIYLEDGTRRAGGGSGTRRAGWGSQTQLEQHTFAHRAGKGPQSYPSLGSEMSAAATASDTSHLGKESSKETPIPSPGKTENIRARNRVAAARYRTKMQAGIEKAEVKVREAQFQHNGLVTYAAQLREEVLLLRNVLLEQASCGCPLIQGYLVNAAHTLYIRGWAAKPPEELEHRHNLGDPQQYHQWQPML